MEHKVGHGYYRHYHAHYQETVPAQTVASLARPSHRVSQIIAVSGLYASETVLGMQCKCIEVGTA
jgi:hypothetical protein